ncbi:thiamine diphosphokinase [Ornithobacterium rhinotracheale]|uniref:thiamine diphosphokinase n=1 Tax=Ornithobacterium rhinotracheale TaxID=28251 RepID=UPI00129C19CF|nr:thiamine diphosphokinase [Ornithobacterium rhinotracheale]MCK0202015.1 thiamine diphosphokinase [Ornithobacterium rhinotracheale]MRJ08805.1 thiamine diphosphokinase [Ornithobacterium rhinotracheale]MRJ09986.1 thiamine diphosphokinase [Ornithobacterium rhinotracheale]UOH77689.1 thiamine diphosphokinase [Ornithobacterium rhinotracheale]
MKKALLLINGAPPKEPINVGKYDAIYCTDGAYEKALKIGLKPDVVVGDFDSILNIDIPDVEVLHRPDQDFTDFDKCLQELEIKGFTSIDVFGATGLEHDHFLGNLTTASHFKDKMRISFHDDYSVFFFSPKVLKLNAVKNRMISLYPFPRAESVESKGLFYPLGGMDLDILGRVGTRNHAKDDEVEISFKKGEMIIFVSKYLKK